MKIDIVRPIPAADALFYCPHCGRSFDEEGPFALLVHEKVCDQRKPVADEDDLRYQEVAS